MIFFLVSIFTLLSYLFQNSFPIPSYPLYHTSYETLYSVKSFVESDFRRAKAVAQVWAEIGRHLGDAVVLPEDTRDYDIQMRNSMDKLRLLYGESMKEHDIYFGKI